MSPNNIKHGEFISNGDVLGFSCSPGERVIHEAVKIYTLMLYFTNDGGS